MGEFNKNDPKYKSCFFGVHVAKVAQFLAFFAVLCWFIEIVSSKNLFHLLEIPVVALGVFAVWKEKRIPLLIYMGINITSTILFMIFYLREAADEAAAHPDDVESKYAYEVATFSCVIIGVVEFFIYRAFWNFARYLKDLETAQKCAQFERVPELIYMARLRNCDAPGINKVAHGYIKKNGVTHYLYWIKDLKISKKGNVKAKVEWMDNDKPICWIKISKLYVLPQLQHTAIIRKASYDSSFFDRYKTLRQFDKADWSGVRQWIYPYIFKVKRESAQNGSTRLNHSSIRTSQPKWERKVQDPMEEEKEEMEEPEKSSTEDLVTRREIRATSAPPSCDNQDGVIIP